MIATRRTAEAGTPAADAGPPDQPTPRPRPGHRPTTPIERITGPDGLPDLLAESDFVVLAAPLTPETESLIDETALAR